MAYSLSKYGKQGYRWNLLLLLLLSPLLQAEGLRSPEAVAQSFAQAYRSGNADAIVALQFFIDDSNGVVAANRERERRAWLRQMRQQQMRSYRVDLLLAQDQGILPGQPRMPQKKLVVVYVSGQQREPLEESYLIGLHGGFYYLLPVHQQQGVR